MIDKLETSSAPQPIEIAAPQLGITLRQFRVEDSQAIFNLINSSRLHLSQFGDDTSKKYPTVEHVESSIRESKNLNRLRFGIWNHNNEIVGTINLTIQRDPKRAEIGYYLGEKFVGKGYMGKAIQVLCDYAFNQMELNDLFAETHTSNESSKKVLLKAGFQKITSEEDYDLFELRKP